MKKQMKRTVYEAPVTELFRVELEGAFMGASIISGDHDVETTGHEINTIELEGDNAYKFDGSQTWNDIDWK